MALSKQKVIEKIVSLNYDELYNWMKRRLHGDDSYFPVHEGYETNLSEFLVESFSHIKDETFREKFLEILNDLTTELWGYSKKKIKENRDYIYELLSLCGGIKQFENKSTLYRIANSGKLKGFNAYDLELHQLLLTVLASYRVAGDYEFWIEQMLDDSNKYYANAAFYALLNRKYDLCILFKYMGVFIDRFKGEIDLELGIEALIDDYGLQEIDERFLSIESKLSMGQKEAVNNAFEEIGYAGPYTFSAEPDEKRMYWPLKSAVSMVGENRIEYGAAGTLEEKAGKIFEEMGFEVEFNSKIAGHAVDIFIRKKKTFGNKYECYICKCQTGNRKTNIKTIRDVLTLLEAVRVEFSGCDAVIVSEKGFSKEAEKLAQTHGIELHII